MRCFPCSTIYQTYFKRLLRSRHECIADGLNVALACIDVLLVDPATSILRLQLDFPIIRAAHIEVDRLVLPINCILPIDCIYIYGNEVNKSKACVCVCFFVGWIIFFCTQKGIPILINT